MKRTFLLIAVLILIFSACSFNESEKQTTESTKPEIVVKEPTQQEKLLEKLNQTNYTVTSIENQTYCIELKDLITDCNVKTVSQNIKNNLFKLNDKNIIPLNTVSILEKAEPNISIKSEPAYIEYDNEIGKYIIVPEVVGNEYVTNASTILKNTILSNLYQEKIDLNTLDLYKKPTVYADSLTEELDSFNSFLDIEIKYWIDEDENTLTFSDIKPWLIENRDSEGTLNCEHPFVLNDELVDEYIEQINTKFESEEKHRIFKTSTNEEVTLSRGDYKWSMDKEGLKQKIFDDIYNHRNNKDTLDETRYQFGKIDFGGNYIEVSISEQHIWMYIDGKCAMDSDVVTGNVNQGHGTRKGVFYLDNKVKNTTLRGADYAVHVDYWMPFDGGIGLHDASWRSSFGGNIYTYNGSHGCVNMPKNAAKFVYENITYSMPIVVW